MNGWRGTDDDYRKITLNKLCTVLEVQSCEKQAVRNIYQNK